MGYIIKFYLLSLTFTVISAQWKSMQIEDLQLSQCENKDYPIIVTDVIIQLAQSPKVKISGSLFSQVDIVSPIKASIKVEREVLGIWIPMPCEKKMGSCTYNDLCVYGYPADKSCPKTFLDNNVPCRCPISKGNYTIAPEFQLTDQRFDSILSGHYKGTVTITYKSKIFSCYNLSFKLYDKYDTVPEVIMI